MQWSGVVEGQAAESVKKGDHSRRTAIRIYSRQQTVFSTHKIITHTDNRAARAARKTRSRCNQIGPLDHKKANICVSLVHTSFIFSAITKPIKS